MPIEYPDSGPAREYVKAAPRCATVMPMTQHQGKFAGYKVFDRNESLVCHLYAADDDADGAICRRRALALCAVLDAEASDDR